MIEWGLTPAEFQEISQITLMRIIEMRIARQDGEKRLKSKNK